MDKNSVVLFCSCDICGLMRFQYFEKDDDDSVYVEHFYNDYFKEGLWEKIKNRIVFATKVLFGKTYSLYDVVLEKESIVELRDFCNEFLDNRKDK